MLIPLSEVSSAPHSSCCWPSWAAGLWPQKRPGLSSPPDILAALWAHPTDQKSPCSETQTKDTWESHGTKYSRFVGNSGHAVQIDYPKHYTFYETEYLLYESQFNQWKRNKELALDNVPTFGLVFPNIYLIVRKFTGFGRFRSVNQLQW